MRQVPARQERIDDLPVGAVEIQRDERAMMDRTESLFDATVDASLVAKDSKDLSKDVRKYLADAHAISPAPPNETERRAAIRISGAFRSTRRRAIEARFRRYFVCSSEIERASEISPIVA